MSFLDKLFWRRLFHKGQIIQALTEANNTIVMVGDSGTIFISSNDGHTWYSKNSGTSNTLNSISFINNNFITFVDFDTILISTNSGHTWNFASIQ